MAATHAAVPLQRVLVVEDDPRSLELTTSFIRETGAEVVPTPSLGEAHDALERYGDEIVFVISDIKLREESGLDLFHRIRQDRPTLPVVLMTAFGGTDEAVAAMKEGAFYYFTKPVDFPLLLRIVREALEKQRLKAELASAQARLAAAGDGRILGTSRAIRLALEHAASVAELDTTVLLSVKHLTPTRPGQNLPPGVSLPGPRRKVRCLTDMGETGTGKELFAQYIHERSARRGRQLVALNCAALPEQLLESELFGHVRGAFTGAVAHKPGKFELAAKGTIFLDEVGDLAQPLQAKILRVLETKEIEPLGSTQSRAVDVRIIAATNEDLSAKVRNGTYREDLFYRLEAFPIQLPPLRDRQEDIPMLAVHFLERYASQHGKAIGGFDPAALDVLQAYDWPGNIREMRQYIERAVIIAKTGTIGVDLLPARVLERGRAAPAIAPTPAAGLGTREGDPAAETPISRLRELERDAVLAALREAGGNRTLAARKLGLTRNQIRYRLQKLGEG